VVTTAPQLYLTWIGTLSYTHFHLTCMRFIKSPGKMWSSPPRSVGSNGLSHSNKTWFTIITFNVHLLLGSYGMDWCCSCSSMRWFWNWFTVRARQRRPTHFIATYFALERSHRKLLQNETPTLRHFIINPACEPTIFWIENYEFATFNIPQRRRERCLCMVIPNNQLLWIYNVKACP
jgi:hypothetical protein